MAQDKKPSARSAKKTAAAAAQPAAARPRGGKGLLSLSILVLAVAVAVLRTQNPEALARVLTDLGVDPPEWLGLGLGLGLPDGGRTLSSTRANNNEAGDGDGINEAHDHDEDDEDDDDEDDEEADDEDNVGASAVVFLHNDWHRAVSIWWEQSEDEWVSVVDSIKPGMSTRMNTFVGHRFMFAQEGTRDRVGDPVRIKGGQDDYRLSADSKRLSEVADPCADRYPSKCPRLASRGECQENPGWMIVNCPTSCEACELLDPKKRCNHDFLNTSSEHVWAPGDLDRMFERAVADFEEFAPRVVSRPPDGPWIVVFDEFFSADEAHTLREWGHRLGFKRSTDVGTKNERGEMTKVVSKGRTSTNTWCTRECEADEVVQRLTDRIERVIQVPRENYESFQLLHYTEGQFYKTHHDMSPHRSRQEAAGPRILTFFLYISDVEAGGETDFPRLDIAVPPRQGSAVLWPSVMDQDGWAQDPRTHHAALPVKEGVKYGANVWVHARNFRVPNKFACTGAID